jgi:hypothetical protein
MVTKAQLISDLKSRGQRGRLSKMTKSELQKLLHSEGQSGSGRGKIELEPLSGGTSESQARPKSNYQAFVSKHLAAHNGSMKKVAELYRQQHAKNHTPEHMQAMDGAMAEGQDFDEAHQKAMSQVGAGDDVDKYMSGGSYWNSNTYKDVVDGPDGDPDIDHFLEGGAHWDENEYTGGNWEDDLNPKNWSKDTWGNVLSAAGVLGLTMAGAPEAEELPAMSNASTQAVETSEFGTQVGTEDNLPPRFQGEEPPVAPVTRVGADLSAADRARLNPPPVYGDTPVVTPDAGLSESGAAESTSQPTFDTSADASTDTGASATTDASADTEEPPGRAKRLHNWTKRQYEQRMGLKKGFMNMKPGENAGWYALRVGMGSVPSTGRLASIVATETGENLKSEYDQDQIEKKVGDEAKDTRDKIDALNFEREEEADNSLAARWQAARDRTSNPYLQ